MLVTVFDLVKYIKQRLEVYFNSRINNGIESKNSNSEINEFNPAIPKIYDFLVPPDEIEENGYPSSCPSVCIVVDEITPTARLTQDVSLSLHTAVCNPATSDKETAVLVENTTTLYEFKDTDGYTRINAQKDLYEASLRLATQVLEAVQGVALGGLKIFNLKLTPPSISLEDCPFSTASVTVDFELTQLAGSQTNNACELNKKIQELL